MNRRMAGFLDLIYRRPLLVLVIASLAMGGGAWCASRLQVRSALVDLLPDDDPGVVALRRTQTRMGDLSLLLIGIRSPDRAANLRYAEALTARLRTLPPVICDTATYHVRDLQQFFAKNAWLYVGVDDLEEVRARLARELTRRKNPLFVDLDSAEDRTARERDDRDREHRLGQRSPLDARFPDGVFGDPDGSTVWIAALPPGGVLSEGGGAALLTAAERFILSLPPTAFHPDMRVRTAGSLVTAGQNRRSLEGDVIRVSVLCTTLIAAILWLFFRSVRSVLLIAAPAVLATVLTYAIAYLGHGYLTTVTSFLVAFVMGNGTNYAIVFLARYNELRSASPSARAAVAEVVRTVGGSTLMAASATAVSYLSLAFTSFRGFSQFGIMGASGSMLAWLATFTVLPALLLLPDGPGRLLPRLRPRERLGPQEPSTSPPSRTVPARPPVGPMTDRPLSGLARLVVRRTSAVVAGCAALTIVAAVGATRFGGDAFEYDFRKLSSQIVRNDADRTWDRQLSATFGRWPDPTVILADRVEDGPALRDAIRRNDAATGRPAVIGQIVSIDDLLPGSPAIQRRKLELLAEIRRLTQDPNVASAASDGERRLLARLNIPGDLRPLSPADLPPLARRPFTEADGSVGRVLLVYPVEQGVSVWNGRDLLRIASVLQRLQLPDGRVIETSGSAVVFAAMIRSVVRDGPRATLASFVAVCLLVLLRMRPLRSAILVLAVLTTGLTWMIGTAGWLGVRITFLNFIAVPFMVGVGAEYAINIVSELGRRPGIRRAVMSMGGPVAICSMSAVVGYGSLLAARSGALRGLGAIATLGETVCLIAALVIGPSVAVLVRRRRSPEPPA